MTGKVFLLPTYIDSSNLGNIPENTRKTTVELKYLVVENIRTARRYLKMLDRNADIDGITFLEWNKHEATAEKDIREFIRPALDGNDIGILSEAGCPGIADPGQAIVAEAHRSGIRVVPMTGPSSILLALMASGMNGQKFRFHGYLPIDDAPKRNFIQYMEREAIQREETQIFMETPYRNNKLIQLLIKTLQPGTRLCMAAGISSGHEFIRTKTVDAWRKENIDLHKQPAIFLILQP